MTIKSITLEVQFPDEMYKELQDTFAILDKGGIYNNDFDDFLHDVLDFHALVHIRNNAQLLLDLNNHFCQSVQT